jgi:ADP-dependent phosphofructokinase/glucokinase
MIDDKVFEEMALMVTRQTELTIDKAKEKLKESNYNYMSVIKNEMGIIKIEKEASTINQRIYKEIRTMMDDGCKNYRQKQEYEKKKKEYIEKMQNHLNNIKKKKQLEIISEKEISDSEENK